MFSVIFDMDGTLLDTQRIFIPAWDFAGNNQGIGRMGEHVYRLCGMNEPGWTSYLETTFLMLDIPRFKQDVRSYISQEGKVAFKPGASALLEYLKSRNIKMAVASGSSRGSIGHHLNAVNAAGYFDAVTGGSDVKNGKPAPDIFLNAARLLGVEPESCFVFEDSENGIRAGHSAGMKCIGVPDLVPFDADTKALMFAELSSLSEAIELFEKL